MPRSKNIRWRTALLALGVTAASVGTIGAVTMTAASAASSGRLTSAANGKCLDVTDGSTANGNQPQMWSCATGPNQTWTLADNGSVQGLGKCLDVANGSTADGAVVHIWTCYDSVASQKWQLTSAGDLVNTAAGKCLDIKDNNLADGAKLQLWSCAGTANQKWTFGGGSTPTPTATATGGPNNPNNPDLGPNVSVFDPSMTQATIQNRLNTVFNQQVTNQFGSQRYALLFKPGTYNVNANVGFFTQVAGLGISPDSVVINGSVHAEADWWPDGSQNATQNFWRAAENLSVTPTGGLDRWAVSQAAPYRRMHVRGNLALSDGGWSSGGWISDSKIDGQIQSGTQQQWITRNSAIGSWSGQNWNQVFVGTSGAPANSFPSPPYTTVGATPVVREKPFLYVDSAGAYQVFVPALRTNSSGNSWQSGTTAGSSLPINQFHIVKAGATAASINAALAAGQNLLFTPGVYHVNDTIRITRANTVVLGLGLATIVPDNGVTAMSVADVDGVKVAGILFDAGTTNSQVLMEVGPSGSAADHAANPTSLHDVFFRVGGAIAGKATVSLRVNSNNVIGDHMWIWRADHGNGGTVGWNINTGANGLVVNGNNVTMYGLFVEHYQQYQTIWNGNGGRTYFYQNEIPYDVPNQAGWSSGGGAQGWAAYKVGASVTSHEAWGLGSYCYFSTNPSLVLGHSFEVPVTPNVKFHNMVTVSLGGTGTIARVINNTGATVNSGSQVAYLVNGP